jgi:hypothetical protein
MIKEFAKQLESVSDDDKKKSKELKNDLDSTILGKRKREDSTASAP